MTSIGLFVAVTATLGCGKKDEGGTKGSWSAANTPLGGQGGGSDKKPAVVNVDSSAGTIDIDIAAVNALVPAPLKDKIIFEKRGLVIEQGRTPTTYALAVPKNWTPQSPQSQASALMADDKGGFLSSMWVTELCDGECKPKAWEAVADKQLFASYDKVNIFKDEKGAGKRTMIVDDEGGGYRWTEVIVAWWADGDSNYHACVVKLDGAVKGAAPAFEKACQQAVTIVGKH